jgi:hypothetical protein
MRSLALGSTRATLGACTHHDPFNRTGARTPTDLAPTGDAMTRFGIVAHTVAILLFSAFVLYHGIVVSTGFLGWIWTGVFGGLAPAMALYEWRRAYRGDEQAKRTADRLISVVAIVMFGLASYGMQEVDRRLAERENGAQHP